MPEYLAPGVYVEEVDTGAKPIEGVSTSTAGFVGMTQRGPTSGLPVLVTSFPEFGRKFGGYLQLSASFNNHTYLPHAVEGFFNNGGKRLFIMRVVGANATQASTDALRGLVTRLRANTQVSQPQKLKPTTLRGIQVGTTLQLRMVKEGIVTDSSQLTVTEIDRRSGEVTVNPDISTTIEFNNRYTAVFTDVEDLDSAGEIIARSSGPFGARLASFNIQAKNEGSWGKEILIQAFHESAAKAEMDEWISGAVDDNKVRLKSTAGFYAEAWVEIDRGNTKLYRQLKSVDGTVLTLAGPQIANSNDLDPQPPATTTIFSTCEFRLVLSYNGVSEQFSGLTLENIPGRYFFDQINNASKLISVSELPPPPPTVTHPFYFPSGVDGLHVLLDTAGDDGAVPIDDDYKGTDPGPGQRTGLNAMEDIDQISIIAAPGITSQRVQEALISQCELLKDRFAILDPAPKAGDVAPDLTDIQDQRSLYDTRYAAIYYPRLLVYDPVTKVDISMPPSGHIAGIYARTDIERGVHKAPANEVIRGIRGLELTINKGEQDILNPSPNNINVLRDFRSAGRGYRVWGSRVITSDTDWKYVNVRRLFLFIEESIDEGTQWAVFEPNDEPTWARLRRTVSAFLTNVWRDGALQGRTPEEAFFVKIGLGETMTQDDIDNGRLIMLIGVAPVKPAEFVIFRIGQFVGGSEVEEL